MRLALRTGLSYFWWRCCFLCCVLGRRRRRAAESPALPASTTDARATRAGVRLAGTCCLSLSLCNMQAPQRGGARTPKMLSRASPLSLSTHFAATRARVRMIHTQRTHDFEQLRQLHVSPRWRSSSGLFLLRHRCCCSAVFALLATRDRKKARARDPAARGAAQLLCGARHVWRQRFNTTP